MLRHRRKKRAIDKIIKMSHWRGFEDGICDSLHCALEYASDSGWYGYNDVHRLAYDSGYSEAQRLLTEHDDPERRNRYSLGWRYKIPAELYQQAYTMHHLFEASWKLRIERPT